MQNKFKHDNEIIHLLINKDQLGLSLLYDKYSAALFGIILRIAKDNGLAEELLQSSMLKVWNKIDTYNPDKSAFFTWLVAIARNTSLDKVRLKGFENRKKTDSLDTTVYENEMSYFDNSNLNVKSLIQNLEDKYKVVVEKIYLEGYSHGDLAKELDLPLGTIKTRLRKAISTLRDELKNEKGLLFGIFIIILILLTWQ